MAGAVIKGSDYFFMNNYEGNGAGQRVGKFLPFTNNATVAKSCIFNRPDDPMLAYTPSGTGSNRRIYTISVWFKPACADKSDTNGRAIFFAGAYGNDDGIQLSNHSDCTLRFWMNGTSSASLITNRTFEDTSKFYHLVVGVDTTQGTAANRVKIYIDGEQITSFATETYPSENYDGAVSTAVQHNVGAQTGNNRQFDGYLAEFNYVDGTQLTPSTFGITDTSTGRWIPKTLTGITYGTNGFRCEFANSAGQTIGDDTSGRGNDLAVTNIATTDITTDSPTQNFATFDPFAVYGTAATNTEGNLKLTLSSGSGYPKMGLDKEIPQAGKFYWEVLCTTSGGYQGLSNPSFGVIDLNMVNDVQSLGNSNFQHQVGGMGSMQESGFKFSGLGSTGNEYTIGSTSIASGDYMLFAFDMDDGKAWWGFRDTSAGSTVWYAQDGGVDGNPSTGANPTITFFPKNHRFVVVNEWYAPASYPGVMEYNFGQKAYAFTAPTGFGKLSQDNFEDAGPGKPDLVWIKNRDGTEFHSLYDSSRGVQKEIYSNSNSPQATAPDSLTKFLKGGFATEDAVNTNHAAESFVAWNWVANNATTGSSTNSTIQVNSDSKFSIVQYNGTGSDQNIGHGLGVKPDLIIVKNLVQNSATGSGVNWRVWHKDIMSSDANSFLTLDTTAAPATTGDSWGDTAPTSSVFTVGADVHTNAAASGGTATYVAYCWSEVPGFSKFGVFTGNGADTNGPFIYTGFKPAWIAFKANRVTNWYHHDANRNPVNPATIGIDLNATPAEWDGGVYVGNGVDFVSNGFKIRQNTGLGYNYTGESVFYIAFASHPFNGDGENAFTTAR